MKLEHKRLLKIATHDVLFENMVTLVANKIIKVF